MSNIKSAKYMTIITYSLITAFRYNFTIASNIFIGSILIYMTGINSYLKIRTGFEQRPHAVIHFDFSCDNKLYSHVRLCYEVEHIHINYHKCLLGNHCYLYLLLRKVGFYKTVHIALNFSRVLYFPFVSFYTVPNIQNILNIINHLICCSCA